MPHTPIDLGTVDNDGTGDSLKVAGAKINSSFSTLHAIAYSGDYNELSNTPDLSALDNIDEFADLASFPGTGVSERLYLALDTGLFYRWNITLANYVSLPSGGGSGDMTKAVYDSTDNGIVDDSENLEGNDSAYHLDRTNHTGTQTASTISDFDAEVTNNTTVQGLVTDTDIDASGFSGNLTTTDDTIQKIADKFDAFTAIGAAASATNGGTLTGVLSLANTILTYYSPYDLSASGSLTFSLSGNEVIGGKEEIVIVSDGVTEFATDANLNAIFGTRQLGIPVDRVFNSGTHIIYVEYTSQGASITSPYTQEVLSSVLPFATNVVITSQVIVGETLTATYDFNGGTEGSVIYRWYRADDQTGLNRTLIIGASSSTYTLTASEDGKHVAVGVTVSDENGTGIEAFSPYSNAISATDTVAPTLSTFIINNSNADRVYFDSSEAITATTTTGFTITGKTINSIFIDGTNTTGHYFTVDSEFASSDTPTIEYSSGSNLQDLNGNALAAFTPENITNTVSSGGAIILVQDDFNDNSLDTSKWTKQFNEAILNTADDIIEQNNRLELLAGNADQNNKFGVYSTDNFDGTDNITVLSFIATKETTTQVTGGISAGFGRTTDTEYNSSFRIHISETTADLNIFKIRTTGASTNVNQDTSCGYGDRIKLVYNRSANSLVMSSWNGSSWDVEVQIASGFDYDDDIVALLYRNNGSGENLYYDDVYITNADYNTETPS